MRETKLLILVSAAVVCQEFTACKQKNKNCLRPNIILMGSNDLFIVGWILGVVLKILKEIHKRLKCVYKA